MKWIEGMEGDYLISPSGNVWSCHSRKFLAKRLDRNGYVRYHLKRKDYYAHRLVALAYVSPIPPERPFINHKDCDINNNHWSNLEWCTKSENLIHAYANGLKKPMRGAGHVSSKLTATQAEEIRAKYSAGDISQRALGREYGVHNSIIGRIIANSAY